MKVAWQEGTNYGGEDVGHIELGSDMEECPVGMVDSKKKERICHELKRWIILGLEKRLQGSIKKLFILAHQCQDWQRRGYDKLETH
ncbi:hypothetical protein GOBAR_DD21911 [Gossypium barbadense]|nr:hypothetical protein GOBAR_DD21911 [Gossypium barbadense]